jgi:methylmalonyl-CoA mutase cobalamin-binding domain/chain
MTDLSVSAKPLVYKPVHKVRFVTAASLFDGHDASINIMRRILQSSGCEVVHLGHNRSVDELVDCAIQEDAHAIAISSYQGGHVEFFEYMIDLLRERGAGHIRVFGGGGGVIVPDEIARLHDAICAMLEEGLALRGTQADLFGRPGRAKHRRYIFERTGQPCPRCGTPIAHLRLGGRNTHYCPQCQR